MRKFMIFEPISTNNGQKIVWTQNKNKSINSVLERLFLLKDNNSQLYTSAVQNIDAMIQNYNLLGKETKPKAKKRKDKAFHVNESKSTESKEVIRVGKATKNQVKFVKSLKQRFKDVQKAHSKLMDKYENPTKIPIETTLEEIDDIDDIELSDNIKDIIKSNDRIHNIENAKRLYENIRKTNIHSQAVRNLKFTNSDGFTITHITTNERERNSLTTKYGIDVNIQFRASQPKYIKIDGTKYYIIRTKKA